MIKKVCYYEFECDSCGVVAKKLYYNGYLTFAQSARLDGWAISRDRCHCFCPDCAVYFRYSGKHSFEVVTPYIKEKRRLRDESKNV